MIFENEGKYVNLWFVINQNMNKYYLINREIIITISVPLKVDFNIYVIISSSSIL